MSELSDLVKHIEATKVEGTRVHVGHGRASLVRQLDRLRSIRVVACRLQIVARRARDGSSVRHRQATYQVEATSQGRKQLAEQYKPIAETADTENVVLASPGPSESTGQDTRSRIGYDRARLGKELDRLRSIRVDVQALQIIAQKVRNGSARRSDFADYIKATVHAVDHDVHEFEREYMETVDSSHDTAHLLVDIWDQVDRLIDVIMPVETARNKQDASSKPSPSSTSPVTASQPETSSVKPVSDPDPDAIIQAMGFLDEQCRQFILVAGLITIPNRLDKWARQQKPGHTMSFHTIFADEIPTEEDRVKVLDILALVPPEGTLIDPDAGLVYHYSPDPVKRRRSIALLLYAFLASIGVIVAAYYFFIPNKGGHEWSGVASLLTVWAAVMVGVLVHVAVTTSKRARQTTRPKPVRALADLPLIIDARSGEFILKLLIALIGCLGLILLSGENNANAGTGFLVGYSLDSFIELFSTQMEQRSTTLLEGMKR